MLGTLPAALSLPCTSTLSVCLGCTCLPRWSKETSTSPSVSANHVNGSISPIWPYQCRENKMQRLGDPKLLLSMRGGILLLSMRGRNMELWEMPRPRSRLWGFPLDPLPVKVSLVDPSPLWHLSGEMLDPPWLPLPITSPAHVALPWWKSFQMNGVLPAQHKCSQETLTNYLSDSGLAG